MTKTFLKAGWRKPVRANYVVNQDILKKYLPYNTKIDLWKGKCYVSLVGFLISEY